MEPTPDGVLAFFDVPGDSSPDHVDPPTDRYLAAADYLDRAIEAANRQLAEREADLRGQMLEQLQQRRSRLTSIADHNGGLVELLRVDPGPIAVADAVPANAAPHALDPRGHEVTLTLVVDRKSFADFVNTTIKWRAGVERYPDTYSRLDENTLTNLLVTTLNVVFDSAHREVYHGKGKTDFLVEARLGEPHHSAYIGEAKVWDGPSRLRRDLLQVLGYGNARTTDLLLLYFVRAKRLSAIRTGLRPAIERSGADGGPLVRCEAGAPGTETVAVIRHPEYHQEVNITIVFAHVPRT